MKMSKSYIFQFFSILLWGMLVFIMPFPKMIQVLLFLVSTFTICYAFELKIKEKHRFYNYPRVILWMYFPSILLSSAYIMSFNMPFAISSIVILHLLALSLIFIMVKKNLYIPYLLLISDLSFFKARKISHQIYEQRPKKSRNYIDQIMLISIIFAGVQCTQMLFTMEIDINVLVVLPFALFSSYAKVCQNIELGGNEKSGGKFSFVIFIVITSLLIFIIIGNPKFHFSEYLVTQTIKEKTIESHSFEVGNVVKDYEDIIVRLKKGNITKREKAILTNLDIEYLPIDYELYFVESVSDKSKEGEYIVGLTITQEEEAISYVSMPKGESEIHGLEHVIYHEYCHVLLRKMEKQRLEGLKKKYQALDPEQYLLYRSEEQIKTFYVSHYANIDVIEDMCEVYGVYRANPQVLDTNEVYRQKKEYLIQALKEEYGK